MGSQFRTTDEAQQAPDHRSPDASRALSPSVPRGAEASCQATRGLPRCPLGVEPCRVKPSGPGSESIFSFSNIGESTEAAQPGGQEMPSWLSHSTASGKCQLLGVTRSRSLRGPGCPVRESVIFTSSWTIPAPRDISELRGQSVEGLEGAGTPPPPPGQDQVTSVLCGGPRGGDPRWPMGDQVTRAGRRTHHPPNLVTGDAVPRGTQAICTDRLPLSRSTPKELGCRLQTQTPVQVGLSSHPHCPLAAPATPSVPEDIPLSTPPPLPAEAPGSPCRS